MRKHNTKVRDKFRRKLVKKCLVRGTPLAPNGRHFITHLVFTRWRWILLAAILFHFETAHALELDSVATRAFHRVAFNATLAPAELPFPMSYGANVYWIHDARWLIGFDIKRSTTALRSMTDDIASVDDTRAAIQLLYYFGNSFHTKLALGKRWIQMHLDQGYFTPQDYARSSSWSAIECGFLRVGFSNMWHFRNRYSFGIDWISFNLPFDGRVTHDASRVAMSPTAQEKAQSTQNILVQFPSAAFLQFEAGMVF